MRTMTKLCLAVILMVVFASPVMADIMLFDHESLDNVTLYVATGQGITYSDLSLVTSPVTQGTYASRITMSKNGGNTPQFHEMITLPSAVDLTDQQISFDVQTNSIGFYTELWLRLKDGNGNYQRWTNLPLPTTADTWETVTLTQGVDATETQSGFDPSNVTQIWHGGKMTVNYDILKTITFDNLTYVPEPATVAVLGLGGILSLLSKHRRRSSRRK